MSTHRLLPRLGTLVALVALAGSCTTPAEPTTATRRDVDRLDLPEPTPATHPAGTVSTHFAQSGRPHGVAVAPNGKWCVSLIDGNAIACGTITTTGITKTPGITNVGLTPAHVALNLTGDTAYTANQTSQTVTKVQVNHPASARTITLLAGGFNILRSPVAPRLYVTDADGNLYIINSETNHIITHVFVGAAANGLSLDTVNSRLYATSISAGTVTRISTVTNAINHTYQVDAQAQRMAVSADGTQLFVANESSGVDFVTVSGGRIKRDVGVPSAVGLALSPDGQQLYVTNPPAGKLYIVDVATRTVVKTITKTWRPRNVEFALNGAAAIVTDEYGYIWVIR